MRSVRYDHSSVHINLPKDLGDEIVGWGKENILSADIFQDPKDLTFGREDEMHITILYGLQSESSKETKKLFKKEPPIDITLGKISLFTGPQQFDVVMVSVISKDLHRLNKKLRDNVLFFNRYNSYVPHVTIAYVKKKKGNKHIDNNVFEGRCFSTNVVVFSSKNGIKESFDLTKKKRTDS